MKATDTFRHPLYRHNCAQAVANHWKQLYADPNIVENYAPYIGGNAPEGLCGALYAAMQACPAHANAIAKEFAEITGAIRCQDIKRLTHTPCPACVQTADDLVEKYQGQ